MSIHALWSRSRCVAGVLAAGLGERFEDGADVAGELLAVGGQGDCPVGACGQESDAGDVLELEGDLTSSNGADRANAFNACMAANDPGVKILKDPTVWTDATAVTDAQNAVNAYGSKLKAIYSAWSSPDTGIIPLLKAKGLTGKVALISDDGVPFEMCYISKGTVNASQ